MTSETIKNQVREFAERTLTVAQDEATGLMRDGVEVATGAPVRLTWEGEERTICNWASQQNWGRMMVGLSALSGDRSYAEAAQAIGRKTYEAIRHPGGLLHWGGHMAWDLRAGVPFGHKPGRFTHELKTHYPYYEWLWQLDPTATTRYVEALWQAHVQDWASLDLSRHGWYTDELTSPAWQATYAPPEVFFVGEGLSFCNTGSDLFYAAAMLHRFTGASGPLTWAKRLAGRYDETRNPATGLVGYQYSRVADDRAFVQFGQEYGERALEGKILDRGRTYVRYGEVGLIQLQIAELLGDAGAEFLGWAHADLSALASHCYDATDGQMHAMLSDGHRLYPADVKRPGYYKAESLGPWSPQPGFLRTYALASRLTGDERMWWMAGEVARIHGLGELGSSPTAARSVNTQTDASDVGLLLGVLELQRTVPRTDLLALAERIAANMVAARYHDGWFRDSPAHRFARIDAREALALLHLAAALEDAGDVVPTDRGSEAYLTAEFQGDHPTDKWGRSNENSVLYSLTR